MGLRTDTGGPIVPTAQFLNGVHGLYQCVSVVTHLPQSGVRIERLGVLRRSTVSETTAIEGSTMIIEVEGDILLSQAQAIAHGMAAGDPMNKGLALQLHEKYPMMHKDFHHWCHQHSPKPGTAWMWGGVGGVRVVNLITQEGGGAHASHPGRATLSNVSHALRELRKMCEKEGFTSVALPRLATGIGGLDWNDVLPLIRQQLGDLDIPVYVYSTYRAGKKADE